jgi:putative hydrolase of the HAD superfamily
VDLTLPAGVIFDFDGTILDTEWVEYVSWRDIYESHGHELSIPTWAQCVGSDYDTWSPEKHLQDLIGNTTSLDWNTLHPPRNAWVLQQLSSQGPRPGIRQAIQYFHDQKIPLAIASSSEHEWVDGWLQKLNLLPFFQKGHVWCRENVQHCKPAPDLFVKAAQSLGKDPQDCWVIEDSVHGLKGATKAGCKVIITHHPITAHSDFKDAMLVEDSMEKVLHRIQKWNQKG